MTRRQVNKNIPDCVTTEFCAEVKCDSLRITTPHGTKLHYCKECSEKRLDKLIKSFKGVPACQKRLDS